MNASVCIATFNGSKYLDFQLRSVLNNIRDRDEVIVLDDCSNDETWNLIHSYNDPRIKIYKNKTNIGHVQTFGKLLELSNHEIVVLCDQDDIWIGGRLERMRRALQESDSWLVTADFQAIDSGGKALIYAKKHINVNDSKKNLLNLGRIFIGNSPYFGCVMAMKRELVKIVVPIPHYIESHDLWIASCANLVKRNLHIDNIVLDRRIHENNASLRGRCLPKIIMSRLIIIFSFFHICCRMLHKKP